MSALQPHGLKVQVVLDPPQDVIGDVALVAQAHNGIPLGVE